MSIKIITNDIYLRPVSKADAAFIIDIRCNSINSRFISETSKNLTAQINWIEGYKKREINNEELYFIGCTKEGSPFGTSRLYNFTGDTFTNGSWVVLPGTNPKYSILLEVLSRCYAFNEMGFEKCFFDVRKNNLFVIKYHKMFSAQFEFSKGIDNFYSIGKKNYFRSLNRFLKHKIITEEDIKYSVHKD